MKIQRTTIYSFDLKTDLCFPYGRVTSLPFIIVKIDSDHYTGFGECVSDQLNQAKECAKCILGGDVDQIESSLPAWMDAKEYRSIRECFSIGLYDLAGRKNSSSVADLLGGKNRNPVPGIPVILVTDIENVRNKCHYFISEGFKSIKLKFSGDLVSDLELLQEVRRICGDTFNICADSNLGYKSREDAVSAAKEFEKYGLWIWEDPFEGDLEEYAELRNNTSIKIMVDEYARSLKDLEAVLKAQAADIINLHPNHQGGLLRAIEMKELAEKYNVPVSVGGCGLLGISTAAFQSLASVIGLEFSCGELGGSYDHGIDLCLTLNPYGIQEGSIVISEGHGLGVDVDVNKLQEISENIIIID